MSPKQAPSKRQKPCQVLLEAPETQDVGISGWERMQTCFLLFRYSSVFNWRCKWQGTEPIWGSQMLDDIHDMQAMNSAKRQGRWHTEFW